MSTYTGTSLLVAMVTYTGHMHPLSKDRYTGTCEDGNTHSDMGDHLHEVGGRKMTEPPAIKA